MKNPKLYIWTDFCPDWSGGLAFAIAQNETQAREMIEKYLGYTVYDWGDLEVRDATVKTARAVSGGS